MLVLSPVDLTGPDDAVRYYYAAGLSPIFIHAPAAEGKCSCGQTHKSSGKHPIRSSWQKPASLDDLQDQLSRLNFTPNVGIVLGPQRGGEYLLAVDVDDEARFQKLLEVVGPLPETVRGESGRGSRLLFELAEGINRSELVNITGLCGEPGVDIKVKGGQVVVAPSIHPAGKRYTWVRWGSIALLPPAWMLAIKPKAHVIPEWVKDFTPHTMRDDARAKRKAEKYLESAVMSDAVLLASCKEGLRNTTLYNRTRSLLALCAGMSLPARWGYVLDEMQRAAVNAGLPKQEITKTIASAEKSVRETGDVRMPVGLFDPPTDTTARTLPPTAPATPITLALAPGQLPSIQVTAEIHRHVDECVKCLLNDKNLYQRDGVLVHVTRVKKDESALFHVDSPQIRTLSVAALKDKLSRVVEFQKFDGRSNSWRTCNPTDEITQALRDRGQWNGIPLLTGISETPVLKPDGTVLQKPGYDALTGYLYWPNDDFEEVPDKPTEAQARAGLALLREVFTDFPHVSEAHKAVPIAAILTLLARPAIVNGAIPGFLFDASTRGSGKTLQTDAIATIVTGRGASRMGFAADEVEMEKIVAGYALRGASFFCLDNVPAGTRFGGGPLDRVLTARDKIECRVLGTNSIPELYWRATMFVTGNNLWPLGDTVRRVMISRLEPKEDQPEKRTGFVHDDLLSWVKKNRRQLVAAALTVLRYWVTLGRPTMNLPKWGSFEEWSGLVPPALVLAGGADPMSARPPTDVDADDEAAAMALFVREVDRLNLKEFKLHGLIEQMIPPRPLPHIPGQPLPTPPPDHYVDLREAVTVICNEDRFSRVTPKLLGNRLKRFSGRFFNGKRISPTRSVDGMRIWSLLTS